MDRTIVRIFLLFFLKSLLLIECDASTTNFIFSEKEQRSQQDPSSEELKKFFLPSVSIHPKPDGETETSRVIRGASGGGVNPTTLVQCPRQCSCEDVGGEQQKQLQLSPFPLPTVTCSRQNLTRVPDGIPESTKKL